VLEAKPDVILLSSGRGDRDSVSLVASVKRVSPEARVIVTDLVPGQADICELVEAGVSGFVLKDATLDALVTTIRTVAGGAQVLPPSLVATLFARIADPPEAVKVTKREQEMLDLIAQGLSNKAIAQRLSIATNTVKGHVHHLLGKLALRTRFEVAAHARHRGAWSDRRARAS
jgi:DNA-binding NarL/FixJ family response regulator